MTQNPCHNLLRLAKEDAKKGHTAFEDTLYNLALRSLLEQMAVNDVHSPTKDQAYYDEQIGFFDEILAAKGTNTINNLIDAEDNVFNHSVLMMSMDLGMNLKPISDHIWVNHLTTQELKEQAIGMVDVNGNNIVHMAVLSDNQFLLGEILSHPSSRELVNERNEDGHTPMTLAISHYGNYGSEMVQVLIDEGGADVNSVGGSNMSPLGWAQEVALYEGDLMINLIAEYMNPTSVNKDILELLEQATLDLQQKDGEGDQTYATRANHTINSAQRKLDNLLKLKEEGSINEVIDTEYGQTLLAVAMHLGLHEIAQHIIDNHMDTNELNTALVMRDANDNNIVHLAVLSGDPHLLAGILKHESAQALVNTKNSQDETPMAMAINILEGQSVQLIQALFDVGGAAANVTEYSDDVDVITLAKAAILSNDTSAFRDVMEAGVVEFNKLNENQEPHYLDLMQLAAEVDAHWILNELLNSNDLETNLYAQFDGKDEDAYIDGIYKTLLTIATKYDSAGAFRHLVQDQLNGGILSEDVGKMLLVKFAAENGAQKCLNNLDDAFLNDALVCLFANTQAHSNSLQEVSQEEYNKAMEPEYEACIALAQAIIDTKGPDGINQPIESTYGHSAIMAAMSAPGLEIIAHQLIAMYLQNVFLQKEAFDVVDKEGNNLLHLAATSSEPELFQQTMKLKGGHEAALVANKNGETPFDILREVAPIPEEAEGVEGSTLIFGDEASYMKTKELDILEEPAADRTTILDMKAFVDEQDVMIHSTLAKENGVVDLSSVPIGGDFIRNGSMKSDASLESEGSAASDTSFSSAASDATAPWHRDNGQNFTGIYMGTGGIVTSNDTPLTGEAPVTVE